MKLSVQKMFYETSEFTRSSQSVVSISSSQL